MFIQLDGISDPDEINRLIKSKREEIQADMEGLIVSIELFGLQVKEVQE
jgi:hypothetical protein